MPTNRCRVCDNDFYDDHLLAFSNMPKAAQNMPSKDELTTEVGVDLEVCQCSVCGLVQLSNDPVPYYKEVIRAAAFSSDMKSFRENQFNDLVKDYELQGKKVIEIGCGKGEYLSIMDQMNVKTYGIEFGQESVDHCQENGLSVNKDYIEKEDQVLEDGPFDAFFIMNFFEHIPDLNSTLTSLKKNLTEGGIGIIEVPNFNMIIEKNLFSEFIGDHLFYFTKETLKFVVERNGFEVVECQEIWHNYIISMVIRKKKKLNISHFVDYEKKIKNEINDYIEPFLKDGVAIYGAGHQSLAIMSLAELKGKIKYVVDDATFKQGKFTPATHVPIVSADYLIFDPVGAIIIMAASYSDEVAKKIPKNLDLKISILRDHGLEIFEQGDKNG